MPCARALTVDNQGCTACGGEGPSPGRSALDASAAGYPLVTGVGDANRGYSSGACRGLSCSSAEQLPVLKFRRVNFTVCKDLAQVNLTPVNKVFSCLANRMCTSVHMCMCVCVTQSVRRVRACVCASACPHTAVLHAMGMQEMQCCVPNSTPNVPRS